MRSCRFMDFAVLTDHRVKLKEKPKKDKYLNFARELKKIVEHENDGDTNCYWCSWNVHQRIDTGIRGLGNKETSGAHPDYNIIKIDQNTEESPGNMRRLSITQNPVKNHRFTYWCVKFENVYNNNNNTHQKTRPYNNEKKKICKIFDLAVPVDHRINQKECEKKDIYLDVARELKKLGNMEVTIVPIVIGALGTITKGLLKGLEDLEIGGRVETIQMTALLRTSRIPR